LRPTGRSKQYCGLPFGWLRTGLDDFFDHSRRLPVLKSSRAHTGFFAGNIQQAPKQSSFNEPNFPKQETIRNKLRKYHSYPIPQNGPTLITTGILEELESINTESN
jgi:hypothetical protein